MVWKVVSGILLTSQFASVADLLGIYSSYLLEMFNSSVVMKKRKIVEGPKPLKETAYKSIISNLVSGLFSCG